METELVGIGRESYVVQTCCVCGRSHSRSRTDGLPIWPLVGTTRKSGTGAGKGFRSYCPKHFDRLFGALYAAKKSPVAV